MLEIKQHAQIHRFRVCADPVGALFRTARAYPYSAPSSAERYCLRAVAAALAEETSMTGKSERTDRQFVDAAEFAAGRPVSRAFPAAGIGHPDG